MLKLIALGENFSVKESYNLVSCEIKQKILDFPEAKVLLSEDLEVQCGQCFGLSHEGGLIFIGYADCVKNTKELTLYGMPEDFEKQIDEVKKKQGRNPISKLNKSQLILWGAKDLKARGVFETEGLLEVTDQNVYKRDFKINRQYNYVFEVLVRWGKCFFDSINLGEQIFATPISTLTPNSLLNDWPATGSRYNGFYVTSSNLRVAGKTWTKVNEKRFAQQYSFLGNLKLQRLVEQNFDESWVFDLNNGALKEEKINLFLDLNKYIEQYPLWGAGLFYHKGTKVLFADKNGWKIRLAKQDNVSEEYCEDHWEDCDGDSFYNDEDLLFDSTIGKEIIKDTLYTISSYLLVKEPEIVLEFVGPWSVWKSLEIYNVVQFSFNGQKYFLRIVEYTKILNYDKQCVKVKCHGYKKAMEARVPTIKIVEHEVIERDSGFDSGFIQAKTLNQAEEQKANFPHLKPTKIAYTVRSNKSNHRNVVSVKTDWNLR